VTWIDLATPVESAGAFAGIRLSKTRHGASVKNATAGFMTLATTGGRRV
jgi:hypothetical protein